MPATGAGRTITVASAAGSRQDRVPAPASSRCLDVLASRDEERGERARSRLAAAEDVHTSDLTLIECDRAVRRATARRA